MKKLLAILAFVAPMMVAPAIADTVSAELEYDDHYTLTGKYTADFDGGFFASGSVATIFGSNSTLGGTRFRGDLGVGTDLAIFHVSASGGVGEQFNTGSHFAYYQGVASLDTYLGDDWTWNTVKYRYRNSFDSSYAFETHTVFSGVTYNLFEGLNVGASGFVDLANKKVDNYGVILEISHPL